MQEKQRPTNGDQYGRQLQIIQHATVTMVACLVATAHTYRTIDITSRTDNFPDWRKVYYQSWTDNRICVSPGWTDNRFFEIKSRNDPNTYTIARTVKRIVLLSVGIHTDKCVVSGLLSVWIRTAVCASIYHTIHTLTLTLTLILTLSLTLSRERTVH